MNGGEATADVLVQNEGSIILFHPQTSEAIEWVEEHVNVPDYGWMGKAFSCEPRYAADIARGMQADGLRLDTLQ